MLVIISSVTSRARSASLSISLAVPDNLTASFSPQIIAQFESAHPDTHVDVIPLKVAFPKSPTDSDKYLQAVRDLASTADVVLVTSDHFNPQANRSHAVVELKQYTDFDKSLNADDFYPALWQSFQWDNAIWALPLSGQFGVLSYDPAAFDQAGVAYPTDNWTLDQLAEAARKLGRKDASGQMQPALDTTTPYFQAALFRGLLTSGLFDPNSVPNPPQFDRLDVEALTTTWASLSADGLVSVGTNDAPMGVIDPYALLNDANKNLKAALLPGGHAALVATGLAVSIGTQYPDRAYALASFLSQASGLARPNLDVPARKSLDTASHGDETIRPIVDKALAHALSGSEVRYADYLPSVVDRMVSDHLDAKSALQATELVVANALQLAADPKNMIAVSVPTVAPDSSGTTLKVFVSRPSSMANSLYNKDIWETVSQDFATHDPQIKRVTFVTGVQAYDADCVVSAAYSEGIPDDVYTDLTPYLAADSTIENRDFIGNSLSQLTASSRTWGYPLALDLGIIKYDPALFKQAGVPLPTNTWTINTFLETLASLKAVSPDSIPLEPADAYVFSYSYDDPYVELMAALGGYPFDFSTQPMSIKATDVNVINAAQQVLDLVKKNSVKYRSFVLAVTKNDFYTIGTEHPAMLSTQLTNFGSKPAISRPTANDPYQFVLYPQAADHNVVAYGLTAATINKNTPRPEACYRWIRMLAKHPELFQSMPASRIQLDNPNLKAMQGDGLVKLYKQADELLSAPSTVNVPMYTTTIANWFVNYFLNEAFDKYVLNEEDLRQALGEAVLMRQAFVTQCYNQLTPDPRVAPSHRQGAYESSLGHCAQRIDPALRNFGFG